jgi:PKD repeat protein
MSRRGSVLLALLLLLPSLGCGRSPAQPTSTPLVTTATAAPAAAIAVTIDSNGAREAIAGVSEVSVDASASTGSALRYRIEFGDGTVAIERTARHTYATAGTHKITVTVTDDSGRSASASNEVVVASPLGRWVHAGWFARANRIGVWALMITMITTQDGTTVRGALTEDNADRGTVTGSIGSDRRVRLVLDRSGESLEGVIPSAFASEGAALGLTMRGGSSSGEAFTFKRIAGDPVGPPPDAVLKMRFFSFGAPFAIKQISPVLFDGSTSRGDGLSYFIEFGDRQVATAASATHPIERTGEYTARLTVVDRWGRSDYESNPFSAMSLQTSRLTEWIGRATPERCSCVYYLTIDTQDGTRVAGGFRIAAIFGANQEMHPFSGTVEPGGDVNLTLTGTEITLRGTLTLNNYSRDDWKLDLTVHGGPHDGVRIPLHWNVRF